jgi:hypothetical protein
MADEPRPYSRLGLVVRVGSLIVVGSFLFAVAVVLTGSELGRPAGAAVAIVLIYPFSWLVSLPFRLRPPRKPPEPRPRPSGPVAQRLNVGLGLMLLALLVGGVAIKETHNVWVVAGVLGVVAIAFAAYLQALWLTGYQYVDLRLLFRWDAWLRPNRLRRQLRDH